MRKLVLPLLALAASVAALVPASPPAASAACATRTTRSVSGTLTGQDGLDVNASIGFDVVDGAGRALDADPSQPSYGCAKTGGYSVPQVELNHFVTFQGAPHGTVQRDGSHTTRTWRVANLPSNAAQVWIEVYSRGYAGSPCKDSSGHWCFNNTDVRKYGFANIIKVPIGTSGLPVRLPTTCGYHGTAGSISGRAVDRSGRPVVLKQVWAWTEASYNAAPGLHGWGGATPTSGSFAVRSLAAGQTYVMWAYTAGGERVVVQHIPVRSCASTPVTIHV